ncbi:MAG: hypothetical protein M3O50_01880 [Myxococcota bacterium]|nr:hypothetical protein [Myxococcota bacterium]
MNAPKRKRRAPPRTVAEPAERMFAAAVEAPSPSVASPKDAQAVAPRREEETCYLCCQPMHGERTKEHFIPRCFYEGRRLPDEEGLCLPAHQACNVSTSEEEQWIALALGLSYPIGERNPERWNRSIRTLLRPQADGLRQRFMSDIVDLPGGGAAMPAGTERHTWVLAKIVKGLCWRECQTLLGAETQWTGRVANYEDIIALSPHWQVEVPSKGNVSQRGSVLIAKGMGIPEKGLFCWYLILHGLHPHVVFTVPKERLDPGAVHGEHDCMNLVWPKPGSRHPMSEER